MNVRSIAHYEILDKLGEGGMGTVFRARDTRLGREVAVKALPEIFQADAERLARFEREAKLLASLNHANIAGVYGLEESEGRRYLVMELAQGEDLTRRIARGALPWHDAVGIALGIARALEAAHENGIIHRDLKPGNIKVTAEGTVKVLDFGLAKALEGEPAQPISGQLTHSPTISGLMTGASVILGTAAYMSPEQARGHRLDRRTDIWAFGVVCFEMLTGRQLFQGETVSDTLASVLKEEPDWSKLPADTPSALAMLVRRCLERNPAQRLRDIGEGRIVLERILAGDVGPAAAAVPAARRANPMLVGAVALAALVVGVGGGLLARGGGRDDGHGAPNRKVLLVPQDDAGVPQTPAISPDGARVAWTHAEKLMIRELDRLDARIVDGTDGASFPFWSPDGKSVAYFAGSRIYRVDVAGGDPVIVCNLGETPSGGMGGFWNTDGTIVFAKGVDHVYSVPERGGEPRVLAAADTTVEGDLHEPSVLPGNRGILAVSHRPQEGPDTIVLLREGRREVLHVLKEVRIYAPVYSPTGHILYGRRSGNAGVWALPFSLDRLEVTGEAFLVVPDGNWPDVAADGTLVAQHGGTQSLVHLAETDRTGRLVRRIGDASPFRNFLDMAPEGNRIIAEIGEGAERDLWLLDLVRNTRTRLTFGENPSTLPAWSPEGRRFAYSIGRNPMAMHLCVQSVDGNELPDTLGTNSYGSDFAPDGRSIVFSRFEDGDWNLSRHSLDGTRESATIIGGPSWQYAPAVSPDGSYIAYVSRESGRDEVYLKRFPEGTGKWQVSTGGGLWPHWRRDGGRIVYVSGDDFMEVDVTLGASPVLGTPRALFRRPAVGLLYPNSWSAHFTMSPDGERFYFFQNSGETDATAGVVLVQNWFGEFAEAAREGR